MLVQLRTYIKGNGHSDKIIELESIVSTSKCGGRLEKTDNGFKMFKGTGKNEWLWKQVYYNWYE